MKYRQQSNGTCVAYALWQIGVVNDAAVQEFDAYVRKLSVSRFLEGKYYIPFVKSWLAKHAPNVPYEGTQYAFRPSSEGGPDSSLLKIPKEEKGVAVVELDGPISTNNHLISYEDGMILDPNPPGKVMSFEKYKAAQAKHGVEITLLKITPVEN